MKTGFAMGILVALVLTGCATVADQPGESTPNDSSLTASAWDEFCDRLKEVGREIARDELPNAALDRAEGHHYLLERLAASIDEVLDSETAPPLVTLFSHKLHKYGMDSADAKYSTARVDARGRYRVFGTLGSAHHIALQLTTNRDGYEAFDSISGEELSVDPSGGFEIMLSAARPKGWKGAWLRLDPSATELLFREYFYDWATELPSEFMIERLDAPDPLAPLGPVATKATLDKIASRFAATVPKWFEPTLYGRQKWENRLSPPAKAGREGIRENAYGNGWFKLGPGEALLIEMDEPDAGLWSFELGNFWWQSIDYVDHTSSLNGFQAVRSSDGRYRLVLSLDDPGVPNWLDPDGHREGQIIYRYQNAAEENPVPTARLVRLSELRNELPADTPMVSTSERAAEIEMRRRHVARRWAP